MYARIEMFSDNIGEEKMGSQGIELSYNDMILLRQSREKEDQHNYVEHIGIPYRWGMIIDERRNPQDMRMPQVVASSKKIKYKQGKQVYQPKDRLEIEIEELRMLMVKVSQRRNEERMNIYIIIANRQQQQKTDDRRILHKQSQWSIATESMETKRTEDDKDKTK